MKTNIRILVQYNEESASEFAERLEETCEELCQEHAPNLHPRGDGFPKLSFMTTDAHGRQTATIQFFTIIT
jgi:hypothetical protein